jgi:hypothetical protein
MNSSNRIHRYLILSTVATAVVVLAIVASDAPLAHASPVNPPQGLHTPAEVVLARADANDQAKPLGDRKADSDSLHPMDGTSPLIPVEQRMTVPGKGSVFVKGLYLEVNVTFYDCVRQGFCDEMYNGSKVYEGAAACSWDLPIGTKFYIVGDPTDRVYVCEDRGLLEDTWVDIFWHHPSDGRKWQKEVGRYAPIILVE